MSEAIQKRIDWFKNTLNSFQEWIQRQLEQKWLTVADHHMAHEYLADIKKLLSSYDVTFENIPELQKIQSKFATFITQYGCPSLETAVLLLYGRRFIERFEANTEIFGQFKASTIWNILNHSTDIRRVSNYPPSTEMVNVGEFAIYDVEHNVSTLESFRNSLMGYYFTIPHQKNTYILHCTLPPITLNELSTFNFEEWKTQILENHPNQDCFQGECFKLFLDTLMVRTYLFNHQPENIYMLFYGHHGWSLKTIQQPMNLIIRQFLSLSLDEKYHWIYRALIFQNIHVEWGQLIYVLFDLMHKYKTEVVNYEGQMLETPIISTTWEQSTLYQWLPFLLKRKLRRAIKDTFDQTVQLEGTDENPNEHLPIEQRIRFLKTSENVKRKAMTKWREVKAKQDENSSKARQYVEGLLRIPFGTYKSEPCLNLYDQVKEQTKVNEDCIKETYCSFNREKSIEWTRNEINTLPTQRKYLMSLSNFLNQLFTKLDIINHPIHIEHSKLFIPQFPLRVKGKRQHEIRNIIIDSTEWLLEHSDHSQMCLILHAIVCYLYRDSEVDTTKMFHSCKVNPYEAQAPKVTIYYPEKCFEEYPEYIQHFTEWGMSKKYLFKTPLMSRMLNQQFREKDPSLKIKEVLQGFNDTLERSIHGHKQAKRQIQRILGQWMRGEQTGYCFGFEGPPGVGKTSLAKYGLAKCLKDKDGNSRPFKFIALGGSTHGNTLEGHNYTYLGSTWGKLVDILMDTECMNPIIFIDELDKVSQTEQGREIMGILTHLVDPTQNTHIQDKYFNGVDLDFSRALIVFSYNDVEAIDRILMDRIHRVSFSPLSIREKLVIAREYLIPELEEKFNWTLPLISDNILRMIIKDYTKEAGVRKFKEILFEIVSEMNLDSLQGLHKIEELNIEHVKKYLSERTPILTRMIEQHQKSGLVNGMWANSMGQGGMLTIEASWSPSKEPLELTLTGSQGEVMKESMNVARTVAWNLTQRNPSDFKSGIHIHCPENATPKDGPSAGCAIALAILSLMNDRPVPCDIAFTGELSLNHRITAIGGLEQKIIGTIDSGVKRFIYPRENERDMEKIREKYTDLNVDTIAVETFQELFQYVWGSNK
jgi:ATP-dependent Lon protease